MFGIFISAAEEGKEGGREKGRKGRERLTS